jgi:hypothetical protein
VDNFVRLGVDSIYARVDDTYIKNTAANGANEMTNKEAQTTIRQMLDIFENASVRDLVTAVQYPKNETIRSLAVAALKARGVCGNCGSGNHSFCNR